MNTRSDRHTQAKATGERLEAYEEAVAEKAASKMRLSGWARASIFGMILLLLYFLVVNYRESHTIERQNATISGLISRQAQAQETFNTERASAAEQAKKDRASADAKVEALTTAVQQLQDQVRSLGGSPVVTDNAKPTARHGSSSTGGTTRPTSTATTSGTTRSSRSAATPARPRTTGTTASTGQPGSTTSGGSGSGSGGSTSTGGSNGSEGVPTPTPAPAPDPGNGGLIGICVVGICL